MQGDKQTSSNDCKHARSFVLNFPYQQPSLQAHCKAKLLTTQAFCCIETKHVPELAGLENSFECLAGKTQQLNNNGITNIGKRSQWASIFARV
jgi:hypothetical protein